MTIRNRFLALLMGACALMAAGAVTAAGNPADPDPTFGNYASFGKGWQLIPVMEDHALSKAVAEGTLTLEKLEAMTAVCSVGLDMILLPGSTTAETVAGIILDEAAIGITSRKTTGVRVIPLADDWARRRFAICFRDAAGLSSAARLLLEHLAACAQPDATGQGLGPLER